MARFQVTEPLETDLLPDTFRVVTDTETGARYAFATETGAYSAAAIGEDDPEHLRRFSPLP